MKMLNYKRILIVFILLVTSVPYSFSTPLGGNPTNGYCQTVDGSACGWGGSRSSRQIYKVPNRWGAIYLNPANLAVGYSENNTIGYRSANKEALENCIRDGGGKNPIGESGKGCQLMTEYRNKCGAIAIGGVVGNGWAAAKNADSIDEAERLALTACSKHSKSCKIHYLGCSRHPDYLRY